MPFKDSTTDFHGRALWCRFGALKGPVANRVAKVEAFARERGLSDVQVSMGKAGRFRSFDTVVVVSGASSAIALPVPSVDDLLRQHPRPLLDAQEFLSKVEWFYPAYITQRFLSGVERLVRSKGVDWKDAFEQCLAIAYSPEHIAAMLTDRYQVIPALRPFVDQVQESTEAFYFGFVSSAVSSLLPSVEGALSEMLAAFRSRRDQTGAELATQVVNAAIEAAAAHLIYHDSWVPEEYRTRDFLVRMDEYAEMLDAFESFCRDSLFARTDSYAGVSVNRHAVLHGLATSHGQPANFYRLISLLDLVAFVGSMNAPGISCLAPEDTEASGALASRFAALRSMGAAYRGLTDGSASQLTKRLERIGA